MIMGSILTRLPQGKKFAGSDCTGSSGAAGRTLTVAFPLLGHHTIGVGGRILYETTDYSVSGSVITFDAVNIDDDDEILVTE